MRERQQSSTTHPILFFMTLASDHSTGATGITPTATLSKDGGAFAAAAGAVSEVGNGWYALAGNATDRGTLGPLSIHATGAACDPADSLYTIVGYDPFNGTTLGLVNLDAQVSTRSTYAGGPVSSVTAPVTLAASGLDGITTEAGVNVRQALTLILDALTGVLSGAAGTSITIKDSTGATTRIAATVDASGNRTAVTLSPPA